MKKETYKLCWSGPGIFFEGSLPEALKLNDKSLWLRPKSWIGTGKACVVEDNQLEFVYPLLKADSLVSLKVSEMIEDWQIVQPDIVAAEIYKEIRAALELAVKAGTITVA